MVKAPFWTQSKRFSSDELQLDFENMLEKAVEHLTYNVLPAAADYMAAEDSLTRAHGENSTPVAWEAEARLAKRRAAELAIALDGMPERCILDIGQSRSHILTQIGMRCVWPGTNFLRSGCIERIRGVANAYKHENLSDPTLPIGSSSDVLVVALGYGLDGFGVGKFSGVEVLVREKSATSWKFLGDAPTAIAAWFHFLNSNGAALPSGPFSVCGLHVYP